MKIETLATYIEIATGIATIIGIGFAYFALQNWKAQVKGEANYALARRILLRIYEIKNAVSDLHTELKGTLHPQKIEDLMSGKLEGFNEQLKTQEKQIVEKEKVLTALEAELKMDFYEARFLWDFDLGEDFRSFTNTLLEIRVDANLARYLLISAMYTQGDKSLGDKEKITKFNLDYSNSDSLYIEKLFGDTISEAKDHDQIKKHLGQPDYKFVRDMLPFLTDLTIRVHRYWI